MQLGLGGACSDSSPTQAVLEVAKWNGCDSRQKLARYFLPQGTVERLCLAIPIQQEHPYL